MWKELELNIKKVDFEKFESKDFFYLTVELYCKVKNLNLKISLNQFDKIIFFHKKKGGPYCFPLYVR